MKSKSKIRFLISTFVFIIALIGILGIFYPFKIFDIKFGALAQRVFVDFSIPAVLLLGLVLVSTLLFGRFYCSVICPFGILQELMWLVFKKKSKYIKNYPFKYFISLIMFAFLFSVGAVVLRHIEPYVYFNSIFTFTTLGIVVFFLILSLVFFKNRFFCTNICPVGTILGLISKLSINKIYIDCEKCVSCGKCEKNCQANCINSKEKFVNNEECIRCLKCLDNCPKDAIKFGIKKSKEKFSLKRRQILISTFAIALFSGVYKIGINIKEKAVQKFKNIILPPGAVSNEEFQNKCYNCNLCATNCPNKIIKKANENYSLVHIEYNESYCKYDCNICSNVCPTGAIKRINLEEKQKTRIAMAQISKDKCLGCQKCTTVCPTKAIVKEKDNKYVIDAQKCIGCGRCRIECSQDAIEIFAINKQTTV